MLGSEILPVRLGGVYALQRLAENYRQSYHVQVMELFCAFVRNPKDNESYQRMLAQKNADPKTFSFLREDVQAEVGLERPSGTFCTCLQKPRTGN